MVDAILQCFQKHQTPASSSVSEVYVSELQNKEGICILISSFKRYLQLDMMKDRVYDSFHHAHRSERILNIFPLTGFCFYSEQKIFHSLQLQIAVRERYSDHRIQLRSCKNNIILPGNIVQNPY